MLLSPRVFKIVKSALRFVVYLQRRRGQQHVRGLDHVCSVNIVVVGHVSVVVILQSHHERDEGVCRNLEGLEKLALLRKQPASQRKVRRGRDESFSQIC